MTRVLLSCLLLFCFGMAAVSSEDFHVDRYGGYDGCDNYMSTSFFDLAPGETVSVSVDLSGCSDLIYGFIYYSYVDETANYAGNKHKLDLHAVDATTGERIDPAQFNGCYLSGKRVGLWLDVAPGPGPTMDLIATNRGKKSQLVRLQSSVNIYSPCH